jgi:hypothetical protein
MVTRDEPFDLFLSYNRRDRTAVERLSTALKEQGLRVFKDDWYLRPGEYWPTALERRLAGSRAIAVAIGRFGLGAWQQREVVAALDRQHRDAKAGQPPAPVIPVLLEEASEHQAGLVFLLQNSWVEAWDPRAAAIIAGAVDGKAPAVLYDEDRPDPRSLICPYRGLGVFREEDAPFYVGREPDLERLLHAVDLHPLVAIVGASGSGKSSLARAGLFPVLRSRTAKPLYQLVDMVPGRDPFLGLARTLLPLREPERILDWSKGQIDDEADSLKTRLERDGADHLIDVVAQILDEEPGTNRLFLLVDQWEELYTHGPTDAAAAASHGERVRHFVAMLVDAVADERFAALMTLRADFWADVLNDEKLTARLPDDAIIHLRTLDRPALEAIIRKPAEITGLGVPDALAEALLAECLGHPGDLPLLEFVLQQLWLEQRRARAGALSLDAYRNVGGLDHAIVERADRVYAALDKHQRDAVPGVFATLVQVGDVRTDLRRRARLAELNPAGQSVARRFADERLMVTGRDWTSGEEFVEVAHEALLRNWPKLEDWVEARRGALTTVRQIQADTRTWLKHGRSIAYQWSHQRVGEACTALARLGSEVVLSVDELAFLGPMELEAIGEEIRRPETDHRRRAWLGERLDGLGDGRPGVGVDESGTPLVDWCLVRGDDDIVIKDLPLKPIVDFHIARYPVTVAQYQSFLDAEDGWCDPNWWGDDLRREADGNTYPVGRIGNHPAINVSWFDALAFCRWLSRRLGETVTLPDDWQWQLAATGGGPDRVYPWGPDWDFAREPWRGNTMESRLSATTSVGVYPAGASPSGALDMAGNVWEWCLNQYEAPFEGASRPDDDSPRVLRGGSWRFHLGDARCALRFRFGPFGRSYDLGFRVVCSPPVKGC